MGAMLTLVVSMDIIREDNGMSTQAWTWHPSWKVACIKHLSRLRPAAYLTDFVAYKFEIRFVGIWFDVGVFR